MNLISDTLNKKSTYEIVGLTVFTVSALSLLWIYLPFGLSIYGILALNLFVIAIAISFNAPSYLILSYFLATTLYLNNQPGIPPSEILFFILTFLLLVFFIIPNLISGNIPFYTIIDWLALGFTLLLIYGIILGYVNGADFTDILQNLNYYLGFITYFAFIYFFDKQYFRKGLLYIFMGIVIYILIRNTIYYREIIIQAYASWQVEHARVATNEAYILAGGSLFLSLYLYSKKWLHKIFTVLLFIACTGGLIITQSRGYWLAYAFTLFVIMIFAERKQKKKLLILFTTTLSICIIIFLIFFSNYLEIIYKGLLTRFESVANLTQSMGPSLKERVLEARKIAGKIIQNPVAGYGLGVSYDRYLIIPHINHFKETSYVHNGYLGVWFKFGLIGLTILISYCVLILRRSYSIFKYQTGWMKAFALSTIGTMSGMLLVNNTSPQFYSYDGMLLLAMMGIFASYYSSHINDNKQKG